MEDEIMKKSRTFLLLAAATVMVSCQKSEIGSDIVEGNGSTISAVIDDDASKTTLDGVKVYWVSGDQIAINNKQYSATPDATDPRRATFKLGFMASAPTDAPFCAYYPYSDNRTTTKGQFKLSTTQAYSTTSPLGSSPMYAVSESLESTFHFKNVCGLLTIDLKGEGTVSDITISATEYLAGTLTDIAINDKGELTYGEFLSTDASNTVSLSCGKAATLNKETARRFYIALPEGDFTNVKLAVTTDLGKVEFPATKTVSIKKNNIYHLPEMMVEIKPLEFKAELSIDKCEATSPSSVDLTVSIKPENKEVYYIKAVETASYVSNFEDALELARADIAYWKGKGAKSLSQLIDAGIAIKGDDLEDADFTYCTPETNYVLYAYAVNEDLNVSAAIELPFKTPAYTLPPTSATYGDYLGNWSMGSTTIVISQKDAGESYTITGIPGQSNYGIQIVAEFDNGYFFLKEQQTSKMLYVSETEYGYAFLSGIFMSSNPYFPWYGEEPQTILIGEFKDGKIEVTPGSCQYAQFDGFRLTLLSNADKLYYIGNIVSIDNLTPLAKLPDALFGQWTCASATDEISGVTYNNWVWTISESGAGVAIDNFDVALPNVKGLNGTLVNSVYAEYKGDDKAGTLTIEGGARTGLDDGRYYVLWYGDDKASNYSITFDVDLESGTISLKNNSFDSETDEFITSYSAPIVFTKGAPVSAKANIAGERKVASSTKVSEEKPHLNIKTSEYSRNFLTSKARTIKKAGTKKQSINLIAR